MPDAEIWRKISSVLPGKGLEAALLETPPTPELEAEIVLHTSTLIADRERQIIADVFARRRILRFSRLVKHFLKPQGGLPIVTTNYDRLLEVAIEEAGLGVDTLFVGHFAGELNETESRLSFCREVSLKGKVVQYRYRDRANVYKPHGSLDWYHRDGKPVRYSGELELPRLIITPGLNKFRSGYESPFDRHREKANAAIDRASRFLVIGYGFNDDHLETHLTPRIRGGVPTLILTRSLSANADIIINQCPHVIAVVHDTLSGVEGTKVIHAGTHTFFPELKIWDLEQFVSEVLE